MGNAAHSKLGRSVCTVRISGNFPYSVLLFKTHTFCRRRLVHFPQHHRAPLQSHQGTLYPEEEVETDSAERNGILAVDICMVLSGMGTELLTKGLLWQDKHSLYCLYSRNLSVICRQLYRQAKCFLYGHHLH